jgi:hypothetical protein
MMIVGKGQNIIELMKNIAIFVGIAALLVACSRREDVGGTSTTDTGRSGTASTSTDVRASRDTNTLRMNTRSSRTTGTGATSTRDTGTARDTGATSPSSPTTTTPGAATGGTAPGISTAISSDQNLTESVRTALGAAAGTAKNVNISIQNGTVTLTGTVATGAEKQDLENKAKSVPGVSRVENKVEVKAEGESPK